MTLAEDLLRHARDRPHAQAASDPTRTLDWEGLRAEVEAVAAGLGSRGLGPGDRIGVHLPNSLDFLVVALAAGWSGATFVALDATSPPARTAALVADSRPTLVVTTSDPEGAGLGAVATARPADLCLSGRPVPRPLASDAPAYLVYTSGTTGSPKGVVIGRPALDTSLSAMNGIIGLGPQTRSMCVSPFHFDGSYATLFGTVHAGGLVTIPARDEVMFPRAFVRWLRTNEVDTTGFSPTYLRLLAADGAIASLGAGSLRVLGLGGEPLVAADVLGLLEAAPQLRVYNRYGPTEATIAVTHHRLRPEELEADQPVPLGSPHPGTSFHVLGKDHRPLPPGSPGELWIGGAQLMDGYWDGQRADARMLRAGVVPGCVAYPTGDLVRPDGAGVLTWLGRTDDVIKRRGVRISLAEVSSALRQVDGVEAGVALAHGEGPGTRIAAFVVASGGAETVRSGLAARLPEAMLPDRVVVVDHLPVGSSGKLDRAALLRRAGLEG